MPFKAMKLTEEQKQLLRDNWHKTYEEIRALSGITKSYINKHRAELGLPIKLGSNEERKKGNDKFIEAWNDPVKQKEIKKAAKAKGKNGIHYLNNKLAKLGLRKRSRKMWTPEETEILRKHWGEVSSRELMKKLPGRTWYAIRMFAYNELKLRAGKPQGMICMAEACRITGYDHQQLLKIMREQRVTTWANPFRRSLSTYKKGPVTPKGGTPRRYITHKFVELDTVREAVEHHLRGEIRPPETAWIKDSGREFESAGSGLGLGLDGCDSGVESEDGDEESAADGEEHEPAANKTSVNKKPGVVRQRVHRRPQVSQKTLSSSTEPLKALRSQQ